MKFRRSFSFIIFALQCLVSGCSTAHAQSPQAYFSGEQLTLAKAIKQGDPVEVEKLARAAGRSTLNQPGTQDMTLLFFALQSARGEKPQGLQTITALVKNGADPFQKVPNLGSVLGVSLQAKSPLYVKALLDAGVSPNAVEGSTPILFDVTREHTSETLKLLLDRGADINKTDSLGNTALMKALTSMQLDQVVYLLNRGATPNFVNINGVSFAGQLAFQIGRQQEGSPAQRKMLEIRDRIIELGVAWPPASRDEERARMVRRGETPDKLSPVR